MNGDSNTSDKEAYFRENPSVLAFLGDAVYEVFIRKYVYGRFGGSAEALSNEAVKYVRAEAQAAAYDRLLPELSEKEASVARRAKNHKITSMPGNVDYLTYKKATAFEALVGFLDLCGEDERLRYIFERTVQIVETEDIEIKRRRK
ncbi:MAG: Mini-ribonuclease 3 [Anaerovoracaceae bacterium]|jgi:ribonuclease-3 family protein